MEQSKLFIEKTKEDVEASRRPYYDHSCAMECFKYKSQKQRNLGGPY
jgi:hypothetical protein